VTDRGKAVTVLAMNTVAFTVCFANWMLYGVLVTFLVDNGLFKWSASEIGWLIGIPVLSGSLLRLPVGIATDKWGGRPVFTVLLLASAIPMYLVGECDSYAQFFLAGLGFGLAGTGFAVGIAFTSVWFPAHRQGTALGIFGAGNAGAALTTLLAPSLLKSLTDGGTAIEGWRNLPRLYAASLVVMAVAFWFLTYNRIPEGSGTKNLRQRLAPLKHIRVWRFGLYYFLVFGGFVALAQWLVPYYVKCYSMSIVTAGLLASVNSFPSGVVRALGGWMSDKWGARTVMFGVFGVCIVCSALLIVPQMDIRSPGDGVMAATAGTVVSADESTIVVESPKTGLRTYRLKAKEGELVTEQERREGLLVWPRWASWQEPAVEAGQEVKKKELLARGWTQIFFQANVWIFTVLSFLIGAAMGIGKAAVYRLIPDYFPRDVGVVGGIVGVIGGLGGWACPILFGYLLQWTGIWTTCWMFFFALSVGCFLWMHAVVRRILRERAPETLHLVEHGHLPGAGTGGAPPGSPSPTGAG
jgi:NNP family nitrate/nitrite transporter-like MFS transporter